MSVVEYGDYVEFGLNLKLTDSAQLPVLGTHERILPWARASKLIRRLLSASFPEPRTTVVLDPRS